MKKPEKLEEIDIFVEEFGWECPNCFEKHYGFDTCDFLEEDGLANCECGKKFSLVSPYKRYFIKGREFEREMCAKKEYSFSNPQKNK